MSELILIAKLTFRESIRNRWISYFSVAFALLAFFLSFAGSSEIQSFSNFDRSAAMLLNILLLFIPLLGLTLGAQLISGDRESGALVYLMSQPILKSHLFFGKVLGAFLAMIAAISGGFALAGIGITLGGGSNLWSFIMLWVSAIVFVLVCISIGVFVSVLSKNRSQAMGVALMAWLGFTVLSDLGLMGTAYILRLRSEGIVGMALLNPVEAYKIFVVKLLANNLEALGAGGIYLDFLMGQALVFFLLIWLFIICGVTLGISFWLFRRQEEA